MHESPHSLNLLRSFLYHGAIISGKYGQTLLLYTIQMNRMRILKYLLVKRNFPIEPRTIELAKANCHIQVLMLILERMSAANQSLSCLEGGAMGLVQYFRNTNKPWHADLVSEFMANS